MDLTEREISQAVDRLKRRRLIGTASGAGHRVVKLRHTLVEALSLSRRELAVLAVLTLRGPQTAGEIRSRVGRMVDLAGVAEAEEVLWMLGDRESPIVVRLPRESGRSADRYAHTLAGDVGVSPVAESEEGGGVDPPQTLAVRVAVLESEVESLRAELSGLRHRLGDTG